MATKPKTTVKSAPRPPVKKKSAAPKSPIESPATPAKLSAPPRIRRKEMVARIVAATGKKPNEVKSVLDGVLEELGKALSAGESLNLPPLGKVTVNRKKTFDDREIVVCKVRRKVEPNPIHPAIKTAAE